MLPCRACLKLSFMGDGETIGIKPELTQTPS
jgi:hypothetical protein